jgi:AmiR/NasT family two-component response regulator
MTADKSVLVVEDEFLIASLISDMVTDIGMSVCGIAGSADMAIRMAAQHKPDVVLMDVRLRGKLDGVDAAIAIHHQLGSPVVFITGSGEPANIARINTDHPAAILIKPITFEQLTDTLEKVCAGDP